MVKLRNLLLLPAALVSLAAAVPTATSAVAGEQLVGRSVTLAGRKVSCGKADIYVDRDLPSEGGAGECGLIPLSIDWRDTAVVRIGTEEAF